MRGKEIVLNLLLCKAAEHVARDETGDCIYGGFFDGSFPFHLGFSTVAMEMIV